MSLLALITRRQKHQTRYLSQAVQLEEAVNPHIIRATMSMISLAILVFLVWAGFTSINEVARTPGEVVPQGYVQTIQHLEGGMIKEIHVREGQTVQEGDILITFYPSGIAEDVQRIRAKQLSLHMQEERLRAFIEERELDLSAFTNATSPMIADQQAFFKGMRVAREKEAHILQQQLKEKQQMIQSLTSDLRTTKRNYVINDDVYKRLHKLGEKGYVSQIQILEAKQQQNDLYGDITRIKNQLNVAHTAISQFENRLSSLKARHRDEAYERLSAIEAEKAQNHGLLQKSQDRMARLRLHAPTEGMVKGLNVNTIGAVIQPGETMMEIVPLAKQLEVSVKISPQDVGHVHIGQSVQVKLSSYDFSRYGFITGTLEQISASTFTGDAGERYYQGRILLDQHYVGDNADNTIMPGMTVMADIITGNKTILQYLLKPIHLSLQTAFSER